jgi:dihydrofolate reductase
MIRLISAVDRRLGIAKQGFMPWKIPEDEAYFSEKTKEFGGRVLSGGATFRKSYNSRPLPGRQNFILTRSTGTIEGASIVNDLKEFIENLNGKDIWVAGGSSVYEQLITAKKADELYLTLIDADFDCDQFFPEYKQDFELAEKTKTHEQNGFSFYYARYSRKS